eukprot:gene25470-34022_t
MAVQETIEDWEFNNQIAYIKLINVGQKPRKIFLSLVAENQEHLYGSERLAGTESGKLTESGIRFSQHNKRLKDKLHYRYPGVGGESYLDVIERIRPVIIELERQRKSIILVCHLAVLRCVYAYFTGVPLQDIPFKDFKFHHIYELSPGPFGCACSIIEPKSENTSALSTKSVD